MRWLLPRGPHRMPTTPSPPSWQLHEVRSPPFVCRQEFRSAAGRCRGPLRRFSYLGRGYAQN